jgi:hypothetical protein
VAISPADLAEDALTVRCCEAEEVQHIVSEPDNDSSLQVDLFDPKRSPCKFGIDVCHHRRGVNHAEHLDHLTYLQWRKVRNHVVVLANVSALAASGPTRVRKYTKATSGGR